MNPLAGHGAVRRAAQAFASPLALAAVLPALLVMVLAASPLAAHAADLNAVNKAAALAASGASAASGAAVATSALGAGSAVPSLGFGALLQTVFGLVLVIGIVFGCAWLARRLGLHSMSGGTLVKTVGGASLGGKERVSVVEIGDTWLVLGTAPGNVRLLHTMPAGSVPDAAQPGPALQGGFGQRFRDALKSEAGKRFRRHDGGAQ